jgi:hypothetical protein
MGSRRVSAAGTGMQILGDEGDGEDEQEGCENVGYDSDDDDSRHDGPNEYDARDDEEVYIGPNNEDWCYDPDSDDFFQTLKGLKINTGNLIRTVKGTLRFVNDVLQATSGLLQCNHMPMSYYNIWGTDLHPFFDDGMHSHIM